MPPNPQKENISSPLLRSLTTAASIPDLSSSRASLAQPLLSAQVLKPESIVNVVLPLSVSTSTASTLKLSTSNPMTTPSKPKEATRSSSERSRSPLPLQVIVNNQKQLDMKSKQERGYYQPTSSEVRTLTTSLSSFIASLVRMVYNHTSFLRAKQGSQPDWADRKYRTMEPTLPLPGRAVLVPFASKPFPFSPGWLADKLSRLLVIFLRLITPVSYGYTASWLLLPILTRFFRGPLFAAALESVGAATTFILSLPGFALFAPLIRAMKFIRPAFATVRGAAAAASHSYGVLGAMQRTIGSVLAAPFLAPAFRVARAGLRMLRRLRQSKIFRLALIALRIYGLAEVLFHIYFLHRKRSLNKRSAPEDLPPCSSVRRMHIRRLLQHVMQSGKCPLLFIREWFMMSEFKDIRYQNLREWTAGSFYNKAVEECGPAEIREIDDTIKYIEHATGLKAYRGYNHSVKCIRFTMDPLRVLHRPLVMYGVINAASQVGGSVILHALGFRRHKTQYFQYWHRPAENADLEARAKRIDALQISHWGLDDIDYDDTEFGQKHPPYDSYIGEQKEASPLPPSPLLGPMTRQSSRENSRTSSRANSRANSVTSCPVRVTDVGEDTILHPFAPASQNTTMPASSSSSSLFTHDFASMSGNTKSNMKQNRSSESSSSSSIPLPSSSSSFGERVARSEQSTGAIVFCHGIGIGVFTYIMFIARIAARYPNKDIFLPEFDYVAMRLSEYVPSAKQNASAMQQMLIQQGQTEAVFIGHSYGTFIVGHCLRFAPSLVTHCIQIDPVCFLIHQMDGPFQFLFAEPDCPQSRLIHFIAQTELGVVNTLARHLWWYQSIVWEDHIPSGSSIILSAKDNISPSGAIRAYLQHSSHRVRLLWWENLAHAGFLASPEAMDQAIDCICPYKPPPRVLPIPLPNDVLCKPPCPASFNKFDRHRLMPTPLESLAPPPLSLGSTLIYDDDRGTTRVSLLTNSGFDGGLRGTHGTSSFFKTPQNTTETDQDRMARETVEASIQATFDGQIPPQPESAFVQGMEETNTVTPMSGPTVLLSSGSITKSQYHAAAIKGKISGRYNRPVPNPGCPKTCVSACCHPDFWVMKPRSGGPRCDYQLPDGFKPISEYENHGHELRNSGDPEDDVELPMPLMMLDQQQPLITHHILPSTDGPTSSLSSTNYATARSRSPPLYPFMTPSTDPRFGYSPLISALPLSSSSYVISSDNVLSGVKMISETETDLEKNSDKLVGSGFDSAFSPVKKSSMESFVTPRSSLVSEHPDIQLSQTLILPKTRVKKGKKGRVVSGSISLADLPNDGPCGVKPLPLHPASKRVPSPVAQSRFRRASKIMDPNTVVSDLDHETPVSSKHFSSANNEFDMQSNTHNISPNNSQNVPDPEEEKGAEDNGREDEHEERRGSKNNLAFSLNRMAGKIQQEQVSESSNIALQSENSLAHIRFPLSDEMKRILDGQGN